MNRFIGLCATIGFVLFAAAGAQGPAFQPTKLIDLPTAGALPKGSYSLEFNFFGEGGISTAVSAGITNRFSFGLAWEAMRLIGNRSPSGQSIPGALVKYRLMEESYYLPGLALGFSSQGSGEFYKESVDSALYPRFYFKSKGLFAALSKSYLFLGQPLGFHVDCNYSIVDNQAKSEPGTNGQYSNRFINGGFGVDKSLNEELSIVTEYDLALDDNHRRNIAKGYLNAGIRWAVVKNLIIGMDFKDILERKVLNNVSQNMQREVRILYTDKF